MFYGTAAECNLVIKTNIKCKLANNPLYYSKCSIVNRRMNGLFIVKISYY
ncbi:MAG: hypothetical protein JWP78_3283 [Mucilaginibacter sp.]|nr:hypothetical protein [Mucilaginibacter sp.]